MEYTVDTDRQVRGVVCERRAKENGFGIWRAMGKERKSLSSGNSDNKMSLFPILFYLFIQLTILIFLHGPLFGLHFTLLVACNFLFNIVTIHSHSVFLIHKIDHIAKMILVKLNIMWFIFMINVTYDFWFKNIKKKLLYIYTLIFYCAIKYMIFTTFYKFNLF